MIAEDIHIQKVSRSKIFSGVSCAILPSHCPLTIRVMPEEIQGGLSCQYVAGFYTIPACINVWNVGSHVGIYLNAAFLSYLNAHF